MAICQMDTLLRYLSKEKMLRSSEKRKKWKLMKYSACAGLCFVYQAHTLLKLHPLLWNSFSIHFQYQFKQNYFLFKLVGMSSIYSIIPCTLTNSHRINLVKFPCTDSFVQSSNYQFMFAMFLRRMARNFNNNSRSGVLVAVVFQSSSYSNNSQYSTWTAFTTPWQTDGEELNRAAIHCLSQFRNSCCN